MLAVDARAFLSASQQWGEKKEKNHAPQIWSCTAPGVWLRGAGVRCYVGRTREDEGRHGTHEAEEGSHLICEEILRERERERAREVSGVPGPFVRWKQTTSHRRTRMGCRHGRGRRAGGVDAREAGWKDRPREVSISSKEPARRRTRGLER